MYIPITVTVTKTYSALYVFDIILYSHVIWIDGIVNYIAHHHNLNSS